MTKILTIEQRVTDTIALTPEQLQKLTLVYLMQDLQHAIIADYNIRAYDAMVDHIDLYNQYLEYEAHP